MFFILKEQIFENYQDSSLSYSSLLQEILPRKMCMYTK